MGLQLPPLSELKAQTGPYICSVMQIEQDWIDYNGHLNMAYYNVIMDRSIDELFAVLGMGPNYLKARNGSTMTAECHVRYLREVHLGDPLQVTAYVSAPTRSACTRSKSCGTRPKAGSPPRPRT